MAKNPKPSTPPAAAPQPKPDAAALEKISAQFTEQRWSKIQRQALGSCALDAEGLQSLCMQLLATRSARHPVNAAAALYSACNGLLLAIGSSLNEHDLSRYQEAQRTGNLVPLPAPAQAPAPPPAIPSEESPAQPV